LFKLQKSAEIWGNDKDDKPKNDDLYKAHGLTRDDDEPNAESIACCYWYNADNEQAQYGGLLNKEAKHEW
jgi:hypothetical protein